MPVIIDCQTCGRKLRIPDDLLGQLVKCPTCGRTFRSGSSEPESALETSRVPAGPDPAAPLRFADNEPSSRRRAEPSVELPASAAPPPLIPVPKVAPIDPLEKKSRPGGGFGFVQVSEGKADPPSPGRRPPAPLPGGDRRDSGRGSPTTECPRCGAFVHRSEERCPRCGEWVDDDYRPWERRRPQERRDVEPHRGGLILFLGIVGIVLGITVFLIPVAWIPGLVAWVLGQKDLAKIHRGLMESNGLGTTQAGWICGIIATCLWGLPTIACLGWWMLKLLAD